MRRRATAWVALPAMAVLAVGCSHSKLDSAAAERQIASRLVAYYRPAKVTGTTCPPAVGLRKGATFRCTARVDGATVGIVVTQLDAKGAVSFAPEAAVVQVDETAQDLRAKLAALYSRDGAEASVGVDCGVAKVRVVAPHASFTCKVRVGTQRFEEKVIVQDVAGHVSYQPVGRSAPAG